jgi:predicted Zn-dependent protease
LLRDVLARGASAALAGNASNALNEKQLNAIGYNLLERKRVADAIAVLQRNTQRFPDSFNAYDSLGEAYAAADDRARAIENYRRSLKLNPKNTNATEMIARLSSPRG